MKNETYFFRGSLGAGFGFCGVLFLDRTPELRRRFSVPPFCSHRVLIVLLLVCLRLGTYRRSKSGGEEEEAEEEMEEKPEEENEDQHHHSELEREE